jgi:hypothetical protein
MSVISRVWHRCADTSTGLSNVPLIVPFRILLATASASWARRLCCAFKIDRNDYPRTSVHIESPSGLELGVHQSITSKSVAIDESASAVSSAIPRAPSPTTRAFARIPHGQ